jgi:hypothetical protein
MATINLPPDFREFLRLLNEHQVEYRSVQRPRRPGTPAVVIAKTSPRAAVARPWPDLGTGILEWRQPSGRKAHRRQGARFPLDPRVWNPRVRRDASGVFVFFPPAGRSIMPLPWRPARMRLHDGTARARAEDVSGRCSPGTVFCFLFG